MTTRPPVQAPPVFSVTELTYAIKTQIEPAFKSIRLKGEISNFKRQSSGHLYFSLKDGQSQISAVMFRGNAMSLKALPKEGDAVTVLGDISVYMPRGSYQIVVRQLELQGVGELLLLLHERRKKLEALGYFNKETKLPLPKYPKTIGVITSPTGAVIQDIIHVLSRRSKGFHLILNPVKVQGDGAAEEISAAIDEFNEHKMADILIVGRGGGSLEDLWPFNEECVANSIYSSKIPIISAVGHETDFSIADFVADKRAPTPSAAAEICMKETELQIKFLEDSKKRANSILSQLLSHHKSKLESFRKNPYLASPYALLGMHLQKTDEYRERLKRSSIEIIQKRKQQTDALSKLLASLSPLKQIQVQKESLAQITPKLNTLLQRNIRVKKEAFQLLLSHLDGINPNNLLKKGYCIPFAENTHSVIMGRDKLSVKQKIDLLFHDGKIKTQILDLDNGK